MKNSNTHPLIEEHIKKFGVEPIVIGLHWEDSWERIVDSLDGDTPYNEEKELSEEELAAFKRGELLF